MIIFQSIFKCFFNEWMNDDDFHKESFSNRISMVLSLLKFHIILTNWKLLCNEFIYFVIVKALHNKFIYIMLHPYCVWDLFCRIVFLISQSYAQGYIHKIRHSLYVTTYIFLFLFFHILLIAMCLIKLTSISRKSSCHFSSNQIILLLQN